MHGLPLSEFLGRVLGIGFLGLDPAGAVVALAAIAVGARRRGLTALTVSFLATMTLIGVLATWLVHALSGLPWVHDRTRTVLHLVHEWRLDALGEILLGAALLGAAEYLSLRRPGSSDQAQDSGRPRWAFMRGTALTSPSTLAGAGAVIALSMVFDPAFSVLAVVARDQPLWQWPLAWLLWAGIAQIFLLILWITALLDPGGKTLDRVGRGITSALSRSKLVVRIVLAISGLGLIVLGIIRLLS